MERLKLFQSLGGQEHCAVPKDGIPQVQPVSWNWANAVETLPGFWRVSSMKAPFSGIQHYFSLVLRHNLSSHEPRWKCTAFLPERKFTFQKTSRSMFVGGRLPAWLLLALLSRFDPRPLDSESRISQWDVPIQVRFVSTPIQVLPPGSGTGSLGMQTSLPSL